jgi:hypothetical protein
VSDDLADAETRMATLEERAVVLEERVRREAPTLASLLDTSQAKVDKRFIAWNELLTLADDRRYGAKEASQALDVQGPNLYGALAGPDAVRLFGGPLGPADELAGGDVYRAREIDLLAEARKQSARRRKQPGSTTDSPE